MTHLVKHYDFHSFCKKNNLQPYMETIEDNQLIEFNFSERKETVNYLTVQAIDSTLYLAINDDKNKANQDNILVVDAGQTYEFTFQALKNMRVMNPSGTKLRWYVQTY